MCDETALVVKSSTRALCCYKFDCSATTFSRYIWVLAEAYLTEVSHLVIFDSRILRRSICESSLSLSVSISAFFCVLIASSLLCAPGRNRLDQSRTSLEDFSREPVRPVYTLDLLFICSNLHCKNCSAFIEKEFIPVAFLSYTCNYYNRLYLIVSTNFAISWFTDFIGSFVVSELSVWHITLQRQLQSVSYLCFCR